MRTNRFGVGRSLLLAGILYGSQSLAENPSPTNISTNYGTSTEVLQLSEDVKRAGEIFEEYYAIKKDAKRGVYTNRLERIEILLAEARAVFPKAKGLHDEIYSLYEMTREQAERQKK